MGWRLAARGQKGAAAHPGCNNDMALRLVSGSGEPGGVGSRESGDPSAGYPRGRSRAAVERGAGIAVPRRARSRCSGRAALNRPATSAVSWRRRRPVQVRP
jgi:hypothetical protein